MLQILLSRATLLTRVPNVNSLGIEKFVFSSPFDEFLNNFIAIWNEDVLYNWKNRAYINMYIYIYIKAIKPFKATKEMHPSII